MGFFAQGYLRLHLTYGDEEYLDKTRFCLQWLIDHRKVVAVVAYGFTAVMLFFAFKMEMFTEFGDLLPYRHPFVQVHTKFANQFGGANNITIMIEVKDGTIFNKDTLTKIFKMTQVIDVLPGINHDQIDSIGHRSTRYLKMEGGSIATPPVMRRAPTTDRDVDDVRNIVWRAYARTGKLMVREFEQGISDRISIVVDTDLEWHSPGVPSDTFETAIRVAASVGVRHIRDGFAVRLLYMTQTGESPPRFALQVNNRQHVTRDYAYYLENRLRDRYRLEGVPLIIDFVERGQRTRDGARTAA